MQRIELELDHHNFFCPVTGEQIMSEEDFTPSPALKICYIDDLFVYVSDDLRPLLTSKGIDVNEDPLYVDWDDFKAIQDELTSNEFVMFEITNHGIACGPVSNTSYFCIDMNFVPEND
jgi:hypothetical protein